MGYTNEFALDNCLKCSICVSSCPVVRVTEKYAGPKLNGPDLERFRLEAAEAVHPSVGYCTNCKNCDVACPSGVNISAMISKARGNLVDREGAPLRDKVLAHAGLVGKLSSLAPDMVNWACSNKNLRWMGEKLFGINREIPFPRYVKKTFYDLFRANKPAPSERKVVYYPGCYVLFNTPEVGMALVQVLAKNGIEVVVDNFSCCGLPLIANGLLEKAKVYAEKNSQKLQSYVDQGFKIITSCPSCNLTLRSEYKELFGLNVTSCLSEHIYDVFEYMQLLAEQGELNTKFIPVPLKLGYHQPCHLKAQGCGIPSIEILKLISDLQVEELDAGCCGQSGSYGFKQEKYSISMEIGQDLVQAVKNMGSRQVLTECGMCQLRIQNSTGVEVLHPIQAVAQAYGLGTSLK
ncbi:anaerobic glycerol-3-phosphate dehydrogenase subunit C [Desulfosporosinus burensis]